MDRPALNLQPSCLGRATRSSDELSDLEPLTGNSHEFDLLSAVLIPEHNQAGVTGAVVKTSAGMAFRIPLVSIGNVNHALDVLKEKGFWIYGLAMDGTTALGTDAFDAPTAFVVGNEGAGIREKTLATCDATISIPMHTRTESLNAAVSAAVVFYEWSKKHPEALV